LRDIIDSLVCVRTVVQRDWGALDSVEWESSGLDVLMFRCFVSVAKMLCYCCVRVPRPRE
jgi:hypothetical protein